MGTSGNADVYTVDVGGGAPRPLTTDPSNESAPSWSRDGRWVYFSSDRTGRPEIWKMPASGGAAVQITRGGGAGAIESVDGKTLYFAKDSAYRKTSVWQVPAVGGQETEIISRLWSRYNYAVTAEGIYLTASESDRFSQIILFYRFASRQLETVAETKQSVAVGLAVWPAAHPRFLYYSAQEKLAADLMLVRHLRTGQN
jgi:Tol biopolymer transport system component